jgi:hypothetical protein
LNAVDWFASPELSGFGVASQTSRGVRITIPGSAIWVDRPMSDDDRIRILDITGPTEFRKGSQ